MTTWRTANAVAEHGYSLYVSLVDGRDFIVDAPLEGDVRQVRCSRTLDAEPRVRDDVGGWAW